MTENVLWHATVCGTELSVGRKTEECGYSLCVRFGDEEYAVSVKKTAKEQCGTENVYGGFTLQEILDSGRDLLGEQVLAGGEPSRESVRGLLPPVGGCGYAVLGAQASWSSFTVSRDGTVFLQSTGGNGGEICLFRPAQADASFDGVIPEISLLDGELPILVCRYECDDRSMELIHLAEPQDPDRNPALWTRAVVRDAEQRELFLRSSYSRTGMHREMSAGEFWEIFVLAVVHWKRLYVQTARFELPDTRLSGQVHAMLGTAYTTFAADHPHYGHRVYGQETHDYFPPTLLSFVETAVLLGDRAGARRALEHVFRHGFDALGRLAYRQGEEEFHGASASEYGQLFWLTERCEAQLTPEGWLEEYLPVLERAGRMLAGTIVPCDLCGGLKLIAMCAEADLNGRIHVYSQNNLWAARGFESLGRLMERYGRGEAGRFFAKTGEALLRDTREALRCHGESCCFGELPPFRIGYPAVPYTLSGCRQTSVPVSSKKYEEYTGKAQWIRTDYTGETEQDFTENCYANYRYYPEMLSSGLLSAQQEAAIQQLRQEAGGEILGMTRLFRDGIDDWPVSNMARYLLRTGQKDRYLLLFWSHLEHHGEANTGVFYEQRSVDGSRIASDCVPSLLTVPLMLGWMFVSESPDSDRLDLLSGVPEAWMCEGFRVSGLYCRWGRVDLELKVTDGRRILTADLPDIPENVEIRVCGRRVEHCLNRMVMTIPEE